jgi:hypothetical protein
MNTCYIPIPDLLSSSCLKHSILTDTCIFVTETGGVAVVASNQAGDASPFKALSKQYRESGGLDSGVANFLFEDYVTADGAMVKYRLILDAVKCALDTSENCASTGRDSAPILERHIEDVVTG